MCKLKHFLIFFFYLFFSITKGLSLESKFKVSYAIILNKLNSKELTVIDMLKSSFSEYARYTEIPKLRKKVEIL